VNLKKIIRMIKAQIRPCPMCGRRFSVWELTAMYDTHRVYGCERCGKVWYGARV
jgi:uncharacterized Zn finger protein